MRESSAGVLFGMTRPVKDSEKVKNSIMPRKGEFKERLKSGVVSRKQAGRVIIKKYVLLKGGRLK